MILNELKRELEKIVSQYETKRAAILPVLNLTQRRYGFISPEIEKAVSDFLELPLMQVREVVSFYTLYHTRAKGKYHFQVCRNMSCHLLGSKNVVQYLESKIGIKVGEDSADGRFSLSTVECLGACEIAPMMQVNDQYVGPLTQEYISEMVRKLQS